MDNNLDMNLLIKKAQEMVNNGQIPPELKKVLNNNNVSNTNAGTNASFSSNSSQLKNNDASNFNVERISELLKKLNAQSSNDELSQLLYALKPYLRNQKQEKIDSYVKLIKMGKMAKLLDILGGDSK